MQSPRDKLTPAAERACLAENWVKPPVSSPRQETELRPRSRQATRSCLTTFAKSFAKSNCAWLGLSVTSRSRRRGGKPQERVSTGVLGAHLGVIAVRLDLYNRARNGTANGYERSTRHVGGAIEFDNPRATENACGAPSMKRRDHLGLFAFARVVHEEEGCHLLSALTNHALGGAHHRRFSRPPSVYSLSVGTYLAAMLRVRRPSIQKFGSGVPTMSPGPEYSNILPVGQFPRTVAPIHIAQQCDPFATHRPVSCLSASMICRCITIPQPPPLRCRCAPWATAPVPMLLHAGRRS
jgi:hypothetical protein